MMASKFLRIALIFSCIIGFMSTACIGQDNSSHSILIFTKTEGYRHQSIPTGVDAVEQLASEHNMATLHTEDAAYFHPDTLRQFDAIVFLNTTGNILNKQQQQALKKFIHNGSGFMGIHAAADTEYEWPWYDKMIGAYFENHPQIQEAKISVTNKNHPSTSFLPDTWTRTDEWYNYKNISPDITVLMNLEESSYEGGTNGEHHPIAWYHEFKGGRVFYTGGGHTKESYSDTLFRRHLWGGLQYVLGHKTPE